MTPTKTAAKTTAKTDDATPDDVVVDVTADVATADDLTPEKDADRPFERTASGVDVVRVIDGETSHAITITASAFTANPKRYRRLTSPAVDANGAPSGPKFQTRPGE